jgi:hypothetical protein
MKKFVMLFLISVSLFAARTVSQTGVFASIIKYKPDGSETTTYNGIGFKYQASNIEFVSGRFWAVEFSTTLFSNAQDYAINLKYGKCFRYTYTFYGILAYDLFALNDGSSNFDIGFGGGFMYLFSGRSDLFAEYTVVGDVKKMNVGIDYKFSY